MILSNIFIPLSEKRRILSQFYSRFSQSFNKHYVTIALIDYDNGKVEHFPLITVKVISGNTIEFKKK